MSAPIANPPLPRAAVPPADPALSHPAKLPKSSETSEVCAAAAILAPVAAALTDLLLHLLVPNRQTAAPTKLYPYLLGAFLAAGLAIALLQWAWPPLRTWARHYGPLLAAALAWLGVWDLITLKLAWLPLPYFPGPDAVLQALRDDWALLLESTWRSLALLLSGYATGVAAGLVWGVLMGWYREVRYWGLPVMKTIGPIPATALVPLAMVLFTNPFLSGAALIALAVWFPVTMLTSSGIANVPAAYFDVARTLGAGRTYLIFRVAIPAALPTIFIGLFMGLLVSFLTLMVAETVGVRNGLGFYLLWQKGAAEYDKVYAALLIMSVFFSGIITLMFRLRDRLLQWQRGVIRW